MKKTGILAAAICLFMSIEGISPDTRGAPSPLTEAPQENRHLLNFSTPVRVLLAKGLSVAKVYSTSPEIFYRLSKTPNWMATRSLLIERRENHLFVNGFRQSSVWVTIRPSRDSGRLGFEAELFEGVVRISLQNQGLVVTNELPLEKYLASTVASEMLPGWNAEALKAQAVASRSYTLFMMTHAKNALYDMDRGVEDQVFGGGKEVPETVRKAVEATRGLYLSNGASDGNAPMKAYFHSRCGGRTEIPSSVWGNGNHSKHETRLNSVICPFCSLHPYVWHAWVKLTDFFSALDLHPLRSFEIFAGAKAASGRLESLVIRTDGKSKEMTTNEIRSALGFTRIKSGYLNWKVNSEGIEFSGVGSGHGVGMCQWGARYMAQQGKSYLEILHYYYPYAKIMGSKLVEG